MCSGISIMDYMGVRTPPHLFLHPKAIIQILYETDSEALLWPRNYSIIDLAWKWRPAQWWEGNKGGSVCTEPAGSWGHPQTPPGDGGISHWCFPNSGVHSWAGQALSHPSQPVSQHSMRFLTHTQRFRLRRFHSRNLHWQLLGPRKRNLDFLYHLQ